MVKKGYLPMWVFDGSSGNRAYRLFGILKPYINNKRKEAENEKYAEEFQWLITKIQKKYKLC